MRFPSVPPPRWLVRALAAAAALALSACSVLSGAPAEPDADEAARASAPAFTLHVTTDDDAVRTLLTRHLPLQRFAALPDLQPSELQRLVQATSADARELLATLGYFKPAVQVQTSPGTPPAITVTAQPGVQTRVSEARIHLLSPGDEATRARREAQLQKDFTLQPGAPFTQAAWDDAKTAGLRALQQRRFPAARIQASRADIDAETGQARLSVDYASGPAYRFGPLMIEGGTRYDATGIARIARLPGGEVYSQSAMLDAQRRLAASGYYDSVFLTLAPPGPTAAPAAADTQAADTQAAEVTAPVTAQVRDAKLQKAVFGIGFSTDSGPRLSLDHTHNRLPWLGWRTLSQLQLSPKLKNLSTQWSDLPHADGWRWVGGAALKREDTGSFVTDSTQWRLGRSQDGEQVQRSHWLQYDLSRSHGDSAPTMAAALSANWGWSWLHFNHPDAPTRGWGLGAEFAVGSTLRGAHDPFVRALLRWQGYVPLARVQMNEQLSRPSRLALRLEGGSLIARQQAAIPATQLFLAGGDASVRGYAWQSLGARVQGNQIYGGRHMVVASVEWQRPIALRGNLTDFESATFIDIGAVGDTPAEMRPHVGVGLGLRWRSPVGPLQADVAWGVQSRQLRLHLRLGYRF